MPWEQALRLGYTGRIECAKYIAWVKTLDCDTCGAPGPSDPSHLDNYFKGTGTKGSDLWVIPQCRRCHDLYERGSTRADAAPRLARCALYLLRAYYEGVLT
jgi:hypothetical protein